MGCAPSLADTLACRNTLARRTNVPVGVRRPAGAVRGVVGGLKLVQLVQAQGCVHAGEGQHGEPQQSSRAEHAASY